MNWKRILKWSLIIISGLVILIGSFGFWFLSLIPSAKISKDELLKTKPSQLSYLTKDSIAFRGKILTVVTSTDVMGNSGKSTGFELTELSRAYYVFQANGYEVDIASPLGGHPPVVIDSGDMKTLDYAFLNDQIAQHKIENSLFIGNVNPDDYQGIFFIGGKGAMFDFPDNRHIQSIVQNYIEHDKVVGAVCHGPAALVNVKLSNGDFLLKNRKVSSFTNDEELLLIPNAKEIFPYLLQEKLEENGALFNEGAMYLNTISHDRNLVTGQNPWSTYAVAEAFIKQLGHEPKSRMITPEENSVLILNTYENKNYEDAKTIITEMCKKDPYSIDRELLAIHSIMATMQFKIGATIEIIQLLSYSNKYIE